MTAKKIRSAPLPALSSDTALPLAIAPETTGEAEHEQLAGGLARTLARSRGAPELPAIAKASALVRQAKSDAVAARAKPGRALRKAPLGPRSGHK